MLKCQWDRALFRAEMGDRTRMVYWVDRERYPPPEPATCADGEKPRPPEPEWPGYGGASLRVTPKAIEDDDPDAHLTPEQREQLAALAVRMRESSARKGVSAKVLPFEPMRGIVTHLLTRIFLHDVRDFFYDEARRARMEGMLRDRLRAGGGPFIVIGHSQGSMIAYNVLRSLDGEDIDVRLFLTLGSPLGIEEAQDVLKGHYGPLRVPECVDRWVNVAERLDPSRSMRR